MVLTRSIERAVEGHHTIDSGGLGASNQVRLGEVDPVGLVHLDRPQQQCRVNDHDRIERQK